MRFAYFLLIAGAALCGGCSPLIAWSGKDLGFLSSREEVRAQMGAPTTSGVAEGQAYDEYHTRLKISEIGCTSLNNDAMAFGATFGLSELISFPCELYLLGKRTVLGQDVRFTYDRAGIIMDVYRDGERLYSLPIVAGHHYYSGNRNSAGTPQGQDDPAPGVQAPATGAGEGAVQPVASLGTPVISR